MSWIQFGCPRCGATAQIDSSMAGRQATCPGCGSPLLVPAAGAPPAAPAPPIIAGPPPVAASPTGAPLGAAGGNQPAPMPVVQPSVQPHPPPRAVETLASAPLHRLSPEERAQRRMQRNIFTAALGIAVLVIALAILLKLSGG